MANRALDSLHQSLIQILNGEEDDLTTGYVKQQILSIQDAAAYLQLNLKHFPDEETPREVAHTAQQIIDYVFSPENLSNCGSIVPPAVRLSNQLKKLAAVLESTVGDVVDYVSVSSTSDEDRLTLQTELAARISNRFWRLLEKMKSNVSDEDSSSTELAAVVGDSSSTSALMTQEDDMAGFDRQFVNVSAGVGSSSSSRSAPTRRHVHRSEEDLLHILYQLLSDLTERRVLSIVGMGGIGKSSLAKIVYDHILTKEHFDVRAWITLSQAPSFESIVSDLLAALKLKTELVQRDSFYEIHHHLVGKRYLIVMDDVWSLQLWDDIRRVFPDNDSGSRIMLTTRLMDVATCIGSSIYTMRLLDEQESWDLFKRKVFADDQSCPSELQPTAKKIVQGCGGLPLSIVKVASLLYNVDKSPKLWQEIVANDGKLGTTSSLSYNHLPHHLRPCFLYMAAFPGDYEIHASELIRLWIAEGFLETSDESKSLEERGERYLKDLVEKNLVLVTGKKIDGSIQKCKLHSTVRDFCVKQAERMKLLLPVMEYLPTPILRRHFLPKLLQIHRRISASWYDIKDSMRSYWTKTIICIPQKGYRPKVFVRNFASLRVLHVLRREDHFYWEIGQVFYLNDLKYLASNIPTSIVPRAISNLQNLQTLIIYRHEVRLPVEIWRLRQLRHLIAFSFHPLPQPEEDAFPLINLQTLCLVTDFVCSARMVEMIPNITKLGICYSESECYYCLDNISRLIKLEKLKLERCSLIPQGLNPHFPQSLKKLTLSGWRLPWSDMDIVADLPHLQILKLRNYACDGECWETREGGFLRLKLLLIDESNLQHWISTSSHFPVLQCLMLHRCASLLEIPGYFGGIPTLALIEIDDSNQSLLNSAQRIQEDHQIEWGNDDIQVRAVRL